ncbi:glycosyltransferase, partial [bacterium]|nr:glycosyltransferase [bacterium]
MKILRIYDPNTCTFVDEKETSILNIEYLKRNFKATMSDIRRQTYDEVSLYIHKLGTLQYPIVWELILLLTKGKKKYLLDERGNKKEVCWRTLIQHVLGFFFELLLSPTLVLSTLHEVEKVSKWVNRPPKREVSRVNKIAYLRTDYWFGLKTGGSVVHIRGVAKGLVNYEKHLFFISTDELALIDKLGYPTYVISPFRWVRNLPEIPEMSYNRILFKEARRIFDRERPGLIYQRYSRNNYTGVTLSLKYKIPLIIEYNGSEIWMARNWGKRFIFEGITEKIEILNLKAADLIVVVSDVMKEELLNRGIDEEKILVNPNGFDPEMYNAEVDGEKIREGYGFKDKVVVGFIGTFGPWHGADVL